MNFIFAVFIVGISACLGKDIPFWEKKALDDHYDNQKNITDTKSKPFIRRVQLYSRTSRKHVQIKGKNIDSLGKDGSEDARIILESNNFGRLYIKGGKTNRYLCFTKSGRLVGRTKKDSSKMRRCVFNELESGGYFQYEYALNPKWFLAFGKRGKPKLGNATCGRPKCRQFMKRDPDRRQKFASHPRYRKKPAVNPHRRRAAVRFLKLLKQQRKLIRQL